MEWFHLACMSVGYCNSTWMAFDFEGPLISKSETLKTIKLSTHAIHTVLDQYIRSKMKIEKEESKTPYLITT